MKTYARFAEQKRISRLKRKCNKMTLYIKPKILLIHNRIKRDRNNSNAKLK